MKIKKTAIPQDSLIRNFLPADYMDSFLLTADGNVEASPDDLMTRLWLDMPGWINAIFKFRNFLVRFVGLKGGKEKNTAAFENAIRQGGKYDYMEVAAKNAGETVIVMKDKHLDAYMSVMKNGETEVFVHTLVHFHNSLGRVYFFFIRPFHGIIVRGVLKRSVRRSMVG